MEPNRKVDGEHVSGVQYQCLFRVLLSRYILHYINYSTFCD